MAQQAPPSDTHGIPVQLVTPASETIDPNKVVLQVGDIKITAQQLDSLIDVYPVSTQVFVRGPGRQQFADTVVRMLVLSAEGRKRKLNETEKFKQQIQFSEDNLLASLLTEQFTQETKPDDASIRAFFNEHRCEYQTWKPRQIVVRGLGSSLPQRSGERELTDEEALAKAQQIRKRLVAGSDFDALARSESDDAGGANGGSFGTVRHGQLPPTIEEAVCRLNPGEISEPLKTSFGYHIVQLESKEVRMLDEVKAEIEQRVRPELVKKAIDELIARTKVVKDEQYYAPPVPVEGGAATAGSKQ